MVTSPSNLNASSLGTPVPGGSPIGMLPKPVTSGAFADLGLINYGGPAGSSGNLGGLLDLANGVGTLNLNAPTPLTDAPAKSTLFSGQSPVFGQTAFAIQSPLGSQLSAQLTAMVGALSQLMGGTPAVTGGSGTPNPFSRTLSKTTPRGTSALVQDAVGTAPAGTPHQPVIAQIDDFTTDSTGFNHGAEVAKTLNPDGHTQLLQLNIGGGGDRLANISSSLDQVIARIKSGGTVDAVNLSQQDFGDGPEAAQIRAKLDEISGLGVPVAVAAGNNGPNQKNDLVSSRSFSVESTTNGQINSDSGIGNVSAEGRTTSFATANFAHQIAIRHAAGLNVFA